MKKYLMVLECITEGASTSRDISKETGMTIKQASAHLSILAGMNFIKWTGRNVTREQSAGKRGHLCRVYELTTNR